MHRVRGPFGGSVTHEGNPYYTAPNGQLMDPNGHGWRLTHAPGRCPQLPNNTEDSQQVAASQLANDTSVENQDDQI